MRMTCINLTRATERRAQMEEQWKGFPIEFFPACDRRDIARGISPLPFDLEKIKQKIVRGMNYGEVACVISHILVMRQELARGVGPEGVIILEDDARCLCLRYEELLDRLAEARMEFPDVELIGCHKPHHPYHLHEQAARCGLVKKPAWGACCNWYSERGLKRALSLLVPINRPADWTLKDFAKLKKYALLIPPIAEDLRTETYIGHHLRGGSLKQPFIT